MKILKIFLLINLLLFSSCGYKVLNNIDDVNFKIIRLDLSGNREINYNLKRNLTRFINQENSERYFEVLLDSKLQKIVTSKDSAGKDASFSLRIDTNIEIIENKIIISSLNFSENVDYNNLSSQFELKKYEKVLIKDLTDKINLDINNLLKTL